MKRCCKVLSVLAALPILFVTALGQTEPPNENFGNWIPSVQSRNIPAGTVVDPGSQLLYIVDSGINLNTAGFTSTQLAANNVNQLLGITGAQGEIQTNFLSITNTHPTRAITIHFRYFNDVCEDLLDFLVILTCNDTLIFDPFNFNIPGASLGGNPINTKSRIFGPDLSSAFPAIKGTAFRSGRFLIFATAAGTVFSGGQLSYQSNILFPNELGVALDGECNIDASSKTGTLFRQAPDGEFDQDQDPNEGQFRNVGSQAGLSNRNLHVFNATAVSFNYLVGHQTTAVPKGFIQGAQNDQDLFLAWGVNAWTRPAVDASGDVPQFPESPHYLPPEIGWNDPADADVPDPKALLFPGVPYGGDNDGPHALECWILAGSEVNVKASDTSTTIPGTNLLYLRNDVHGGNSIRARAANVLGLSEASASTGASISGRGVGGVSNWGALAWTSLHTAEPQNQRLEFLSFVDDYDGSKNTAVAAQIGATTIRDRSYNLTGAETMYIVQIYDNNEDKLDLTPDTPINISPPPTTPQTANLRIIVDCLLVWINGRREEATRRDGLSIFNLYEITDLVRIGNGAFDGLGATVNPLNDASQGWIRFVRDNNHTRTATLSLGAPNPTGSTETVTLTGGTIAPINPTTMDNAHDPSFVTIAQTVLKFEGFGASWWAPSAAFDPAVSEADPTVPSP
jgi:hypothetical protein